jgi:hypothetical protein
MGELCGFGEKLHNRFRERNGLVAVRAVAAVWKGLCQCVGTTSRNLVQLLERAIFVIFAL